MSALAVVTAVRSRWQAQWSHTSTAHENQAYTPVAGSAWVRLTVRPAGAQQASLGTPSLDRHSGIVFLQIFTPLDQGQDRSQWLADRAAAVFRKVDVAASPGSMVFGVPYQAVAETGGDNWHQINVVCPYTFDLLT